MVGCKAPFLLASLATLRKYSCQFRDRDAINEEKSAKKVQRKRNYFKGARREDS